MGKLIICAGGNFVGNSVKRVPIGMVDEGFFGANMASDGTYAKSTYTYQTIASTYKRQAQPSSSVSLSVSNAYTTRKVLVKVFEYDANKNFIQRVYDASYASRGRNFTFTFTTSATTKYISIGFEVVFTSGAHDETREKTLQTYNSLVISGSEDNKFEGDSFEVYNP